MKTTIIRGVELNVGSLVYFVRAGEPDFAILHPESITLDYAMPRIESRTILATNGTTFAFGRQHPSRSAIKRHDALYDSVRQAAIRTPWAWIEDPEYYYVTIEEAQAEVEAIRAKYLDRAREIVAQREEALANMQQALENARTQLAALEAGTHPSLQPIAQAVTA